MSTQRDVEQLLRSIPLATPTDESKAVEMFQCFNDVRDAAFEGAHIEAPGLATYFSIPMLINKLRERQYADVAVALISVAGDAASALSFIVTAGVEAEVIGVTSALGLAGAAAGMVGEAAGPAALAANVLVATVRIPSDVTANNSKLYFLSDASGILTSWMFNMPEVNPHTRLTRNARTGGYLRTDVSEQCRLAHQKVHQLWRSYYQGNQSAQRQEKQSAGDNWERYWLQLGAALAQKLAPRPTGVGTLWIQGLINDANARIRQAASDGSMRAFEQRQRRADGGYWLRTSGGIELFVPDP